MNVIIDARPAFEGKPAALLTVAGRTVLERHLALASKLGTKVYVIETPDRALSSDVRFRGKAEFCLEAPAGEAVRLSTANIYKEGKPRVVWTLRSAADITNAEGELERCEFFTISKHTLRPLGKRLAAFLYAHTPLQANHLTVLRILFGLLGAYLFLLSHNLAAGCCVLFSWFLDLTDGQLARLRSRVSKFGAYLDSVGDGVVDNLYYLAIAAALYPSRPKLAMALGASFLFGKYVFVNSTLLAPTARPAASATAAPAVTRRTGARAVVKAVISKMDDTDVRIHFLAVAAWLQAPVVPLVFHAVYFNIRWVLNLVNAYYKFEIRKEAA